LAFLVARLKRIDASHQPTEVLERLKSFAFDGKPRSGATVQPYTRNGDLPASAIHPVSNDDFGATPAK
jgi:hypothetical protein